MFCILPLFFSSIGASHEANEALGVLPGTEVIAASGMLSSIEHCFNVLALWPEDGSGVRCACWESWKIATQLTRKKVRISSA